MAEFLWALKNSCMVYRCIQLLHLHLPPTRICLPIVDNDPSDSDASLGILGRVPGRSHSCVSLQGRPFSLKRFGSDWYLSWGAINQAHTRNSRHWQDSNSHWLALRFTQWVKSSKMIQKVPSSRSAVRHNKQASTMPSIRQWFLIFNVLQCTQFQELYYPFHFKHLLPLS